jgi:hypothetical protein
VTLETGLQKQAAKWDPTGAKWDPTGVCIFIHLPVLQINERRYNASVGEGHISDLRDRATGTGGQVGPDGCQVEVPVLRLPSSSRPSN